MTVLLDTHLLLWALVEPEKLPAAAKSAVADPGSHLWFSAASIWEVSIKAALGRSDFAADPHVVRGELLRIGFIEVAITGTHAAVAGGLPPIHRDPFDRMLVAQATVEGVPLLTCDPQIARYPGPVQLL